PPASSKPNIALPRLRFLTIGLPTSYPAAWRHRFSSRSGTSAARFAPAESGCVLTVPFRWRKHAASAASCSLGVAAARIFRSSAGVSRKSPFASGSGWGMPCARMQRAYATAAACGSRRGAGGSGFGVACVDVVVPAHPASVTASTIHAARRITESYTARGGGVPALRGRQLLDEVAVRGEVELLDVLDDHPARVEPRAQLGDRVPHERDPPRALAVERRDDLVLEHGEEGVGVRLVLRVVVRGDPVAADREAGLLGVALAPPAVEDRHVDDAVQGGLHARRAGRLERPARVVEPDVDALHEVARQRHLVVGQEDDASVRLRAPRERDDLLDKRLPA